MIPLAGSIICGVDDSTSATGVMQVARALGETLGRPLVFVRVVEPGSPEREIDAIAERLSLVADRKTIAGQALWLVDVGDPADRLVAAATDEKASLIVLGSRGPRSPLVDSVSADVARRAPCPVVVVPPGATASWQTSESELRFAAAHVR
jgi:nucleotide-binding universal stress UspA family protein